MNPRRRDVGAGIGVEDTVVLSDISIKRPVFITMIMLAFVVLGGFAFRRLSVDEFPNVDLPVVTVTTAWPGAPS